MGSIARILVPDIEACGPSVVHVTDNFILPFAPVPTADSPVAAASEASPERGIHPAISWGLGFSRVEMTL